jgi:hypothetical protein
MMIIYIRLLERKISGKAGILWLVFWVYTIYKKNV